MKFPTGRVVCEQNFFLKSRYCTTRCVNSSKCNFFLGSVCVKTDNLSIWVRCWCKGVQCFYVFSVDVLITWFTLGQNDVSNQQPGRTESLKKMVLFGTLQFSGSCRASVVVVQESVCTSWCHVGKKNPLCTSLNSSIAIYVFFFPWFSFNRTLHTSAASLVSPVRSVMLNR